MQRAGIESILGLETWPRFEMTVRYRSAHHEILIENPDGVCHGIIGATVDEAAVGKGRLVGECSRTASPIEP